MKIFGIYTIILFLLISSNLFANQSAFSDDLITSSCKMTGAYLSSDTSVAAETFVSCKKQFELAKCHSFSRFSHQISCNQKTFKNFIYSRKSVAAPINSSLKIEFESYFQKINDADNLKSALMRITKSADSRTTQIKLLSAFENYTACTEKLKKIAISKLAAASDRRHFLNIVIIGTLETERCIAVAQESLFLSRPVI